MTEKLSILVLESDPDDIFFLSALLKKLHAKEIEAHSTIKDSLQEGIAALSEKEFDLIITDLYLSDSEGTNTFLELQKRANSIPIIILGSFAEEALARETIKLGAEDYIPKSDLNPDLLARIIHYAIERHRLQKSLKALSFTDGLTGAYNRRGFVTLLEQHMSLTRRNKKGFFLLLIDCDYLKQINDTYGHLMGDYALTAITKHLQETFRKHDVIGRIGGDEFGVIVINTDPDSGVDLKNQMLHQLQKNNSQSKKPFQLSYSIGMAHYDGMCEMTIEELFLIADRDLYEQKSHRPAFRA